MASQETIEHNEFKQDPWYVYVRSVWKVLNITVYAVCMGYSMWVLIEIYRLVRNQPQLGSIKRQIYIFIAFFSS